MKRLFQVLLVMVIMVQPVIASADMVVFWGNRVIDRSALSAIVQEDKGRIFVVFYNPYDEKQIFWCNDNYEQKYKATVDAILETLAKDKNIHPFDIFKKAGLTGCKNR